MGSFFREVKLLGGLITALTSVVQAQALNLNCNSAQGDSEVETKVQVQELNPETSPDKWKIRVARTEKHASVGHMAYHGGLGINTRREYEQVWLYTGFDQTNDPMKLQAGGLTYSDFGLRQFPVVCKNLAGVDQAKDLIPSEIPCGGSINISTHISAVLTAAGPYRRDLVVSYQAETSEGSVSKDKNALNVGFELPLQGSAKLKFSLFGRLGSALDGALILPGQAEPVKLACTLD
jgi:hypothetical protein